MTTYCCDNCGKQVTVGNLLKLKINRLDVELCYECNANYISKLEAASNKVDEEFMSNMKHQPFAFKFNCM